MKKLLLIITIFIFAQSCNNKETSEKSSITTNVETPFVWEGANIYFLLTDRFNNGNLNNDINFNRDKKTGVLRGFEGGDIVGITKKIEDGYLGDLGINAIWFTPIVEQIHDSVDEGTGNTYGYHGYWAKDWTALDPNFGTMKDLKNLVEIAHKNGIRIIMDGVINHTGPVTNIDPVWPKNWVRTSPTCEYKDYNSTVSCTLVENLPDIKTEDESDVKLPSHLIEKWKKEGRYEQEIKELDEFFTKTGHPRAPKYYIIKWLTDYIREFGIDGYRADTVKHTEEGVWQEFKTECDIAFAEWKKNNPKKVLDENKFYLVGEVYGYGISAGKSYDFGDKKVDYFDDAFSSLINFEFKWDAEQKSYEEIFSKYSDLLNSELKNFGTLNYLTSHDDGQPFDKARKKSFESGTKLLLSPGTSQVYYGDESSRSLIIEGTIGDATLRSNMNWEEIDNDEKTKEILKHWQKLGKFRTNHPAIGSGIHTIISEKPYIFQRKFEKGTYIDGVVIGLDLEKGKKEINIGNIFKNGDVLREAYSGEIVFYKNGNATLDTPYSIVLIEKIN